MRRVLIIYTGGTIGMIKNSSSGTLEPFDFNHLLKHIPELGSFDFQIDNITFSHPIDSSDMEPSLWIKLAHIIHDQYDAYEGFVILHGTDTMAYTASALSFMLENLGKPVILTGSQLPIGVLRTDGRENLITSVEIAAAHDRDNRPIVPEVCIFFGQHLYRGNRTTKENADKFNAFTSYNYPPLARAGIHIDYFTDRILRPCAGAKLLLNTKLDNSVLALTLFPGIKESLIERVLQMKEIKGVVMRTYGSGNAPTSTWFLNALRKATDKGKVIVNITQCQSGSVEMGMYRTGVSLLKSGVVSGHDMTVECAVTKLMTLLGKGQTADEVRKQMETPIAGEISLKNNICG